MCGISGIIDMRGHRVDELSIRKMTDIIVHRGPDDEGYYYGDNFAFGHRRLSILDLSSRGHQPMEYLDQYVITYNGEVYNYIELREELKKMGYAFITETDTEVIMAAYDKWGIECVKRFNGMWAFAIYDKRDRIVFCSRDRFGIKPFCYTKCENLFLFASEAKQFTAIDQYTPALNHQVAANFLVFSVLNQSENSFFENVFFLKGGCNLVYHLDSHKFEISRWYDINDVGQHPGISFEEASNEFYRLFENSVMLRMRSDVKVGSCLSGGLDSSSIVCMIRELAGTRSIETISSCYEQREYDEREYIDQVIDKTNFINHKIFPELNDLLRSGVLDKIVYHQDQPILRASHFSEYSVFEEARRRGMIVMLDGQGADEYLAGYGEFYAVHYSKLLMSGKLLALWVEMKARKALVNKPYYMSLKAAIGYSFNRNKRVTEIPKWFQFTDKTDRRSVVDPIDNYKSGEIGINTLSKLQLAQTSIPYQLHSEDRNSMLHSVESRLPFLDYKLLEFTLSLPEDFKISKGKTKAVLRNSLARILPPEIVNRHDKMGFVAPEGPWVLKEHVEIGRELDTGIERSQGLLNTKLKEDFDDFIDGKIRYNPVFFRVLSFSKWMNAFGIG